MKSVEICEVFFCFFEEKGYICVVFSLLILVNDLILLFINVGMNQFKDCFFGLEKCVYICVIISQKCVCVGGKYNDLENVGYIVWYYIFFEMLGNFSFGDYFKCDVIYYVWEFFIGEKWLNLFKEKFWVIVYVIDDEVYDIWIKEVGVFVECMVWIGDNKGVFYVFDNFWVMGDIGFCGFCIEIFFDYGLEIWGGLFGLLEEDGDCYIEIWNNVFMQFNCIVDGVMYLLLVLSVDIGMGLECVSVVFQYVYLNYEIDLFQNLLKVFVEVIGCVNDDVLLLKVVVDYICFCSFLIVDGVLLFNEGCGYVLWWIICCVCCYGNKLGVRGIFFYKIVVVLVIEMGDVFFELK